MYMFLAGYKDEARHPMQCKTVFRREFADAVCREQPDLSNCRTLLQALRLYKIWARNQRDKLLELWDVSLFRSSSFASTH